jgi:hypothetical protein
MWMQNNYDLSNVALIYLAGPSKHNFNLCFFWPHKQRNFMFLSFLDT